MTLLSTLYNMPDFSQPDIWLSLLTLTFLEVILGIDNIIFISILSSRVAPEKRAKVMRMGLLLAMLFRVMLLFGISWLVALTEPLFSLDIIGIKAGFTGQALVLIAGGIFLLYKSTTEIGHKLEGKEHAVEGSKAVKTTVAALMVQIVLIDIVFSFDSILTAVGMTSGVNGALWVMVISVMIAIFVMMLFAVPVGKFVNEHPTIQMLALAFLILIGFMLITEGAHHSHMTIAGEEVGAVPKGYLYFAIAFSLLVEVLNMRMRKSANKKVKLHSVTEQANDEGLFEEK
jgi:predicted tellurium resistance membrane protein TerC